MSDNVRSAARAARAAWEATLKAVSLAEPTDMVKDTLEDMNDAFRPLLDWAARYGEWPRDGEDDVTLPGVDLTEG